MQERSGVRAYPELVWNDITHTAPTLTLPQRERGRRFNRNCVQSKSKYALARR